MCVFNPNRSLGFAWPNDRFGFNARAQYVSRLKHAKACPCVIIRYSPFFLEEAEGLLLDFFFCFLEV